MKNSKKALAALLAGTVAAGVVGGLVGCAPDDRFDVSIFAYKYDDSYIATVREALSTRFEVHKDDINFTIYNGEGNQATQSTQIDAAIQRGTDLLVINAVDFQSAGEALADKAKAANLPAIFFNREVSDNAVNKADNFCFIGTDPDAPGYMIGEMVSDMIKTDTDFQRYDRNGNGKIDYLMLRAEPGNAEADGRTLYSVTEADRLLNANTSLTSADKTTTQDITTSNTAVNLKVLNRLAADENAEWQTSMANTKVSAWLSSYENDVDMIIANNDDMALGAISALNTKGYNTANSKTQNPTKFIPVFGVDALATAVTAINDGKMQGTVKQDGDAMAKAIVEVSLNIKNGKSSGNALLDGTDYTWDGNVRKIRIPYSKVS